MKTNHGHEAYLKGKEDADTIYKLWGIQVIKEISKYSERNKDDYHIGKIERCKEILSSYKKN
jgi:ribosomal 30S subunit maturation factor RimM